MNRQRIVLAVLAGVLVLSLAYAFWAMPRQQQAPPRTAAPPAKPRTVPGKPVAGKAGPSAERLNLELLNTEQEPFPDSGRDIFRFRGGWAPVAVAPEPAVPAVKPEPPPPPPPPTPEQLLRQALAGFKVLGYLDKGGTRSVFLADDRDIYVVRAGQPFGTDNRFVVTEIAGTELVISAADHSATVRLPMGESGTREPAIMAPVTVPRAEVEIEPAPAGSPGGRRFRRPPAADGGAPAPMEVPQPMEAPQPQMEESAPGSAPVEMEQPGGGNGEKE